MWVTDPKTGEKSVSLTVLALSTVVMVVAIGLQLSGIAKDVSLATEWWFGAAGLYWGRKFTTSKGQVGPEPLEKEDAK
jgi:hypothetical protein